jgi:hypothetical protein
MTLLDSMSGLYWESVYKQMHKKGKDYHWNQAHFECHAYQSGSEFPGQKN